MGNTNVKESRNSDILPENVITNLKEWKQLKYQKMKQRDMLIQFQKEFEREPYPNNPRKRNHQNESTDYKGLLKEYVVTNLQPFNPNNCGKHVVLSQNNFVASLCDSKLVEDMDPSERYSSVSGMLKIKPKYITEKIYLFAFLLLENSSAYLGVTHHSWCAKNQQGAKLIEKNSFYYQKSSFTSEYQFTSQQYLIETGKHVKSILTINFSKYISQKGDLIYFLLDQRNKSVSIKINESEFELLYDYNLAGPWFFQKWRLVPSLEFTGKGKIQIVSPHKGYAHLEKYLRQIPQYIFPLLKIMNDSPSPTEISQSQNLISQETPGHNPYEPSKFEQEEINLQLALKFSQEDMNQEKYDKQLEELQEIIRNQEQDFQNQKQSMKKELCRKINLLKDHIGKLYKEKNEINERYENCLLEKEKDHQKLQQLQMQSEQLEQIIKEKQQNIVMIVHNYNQQGDFVMNGAIHKENQYHSQQEEAQP